MSGHCAFLTMDSMAGFVCDDDLAIPALEALDWEVERISWRASDTYWNRFAIVVIRSAWDYPTDAPRFLATLGEIEASSAVLQNPLELVRWNLNKSYLARLAERGVSVVPTRWLDQPQQHQIMALFSEFGTDNLVIKPAVGTNAEHAHVLNVDTIERDWPGIERVFARRQAMLQPFRSAIQSEGEYSLMFMDGELSHTIRKKPKEGDFRSQEEHGAEILLVEPESRLVMRAAEAIAALDARPLYGRADMIRNPDGDFEVMELELIEPSLYLRMDRAAPERFAQAILRRATHTGDSIATWGGTHSGAPGS